MTGAAKRPLLAVEDLHITATIDAEQRTLVSNVALSVEAGEVLSIVGESGSGKSVTARALVGLLARGLRASGRIAFEGRDLIAAGERELQAVRGSGIALVLQDPYTTLNPLMKCRAQLEPVGGRPAGGSGRTRPADRLAEVGIEDPNVADRYPWQLSGGMRQRVALAAALANEPKLLIADEFTSALDVTTQREIWLLLRRIQAARDMGMIVITHDLRMAFSLSDRVHVMYSGSVLETGRAQDVADRPMHPYTFGLLLSEPDMTTRAAAPDMMRGSVPRPDDVLTCCAFAARCPWVTHLCTASRPTLTYLEPNRATACVRIEAIKGDMAARRQQAVDEASVSISQPAPADAGTVLAVRELKKVFGMTGGRPDKRAVVALAGVSVEIASGESVGLVGESGSGKTTLARCIVGLERPTAGSIELCGVDATDREHLTRQQRSRLRSTVQYVFQDPYSSLNPTKTVGGTLTEAVTLKLGRDRGRVTARVDELLSLVGLPASYKSRKPIALSGGERQRVAIARALALEPRLVICDEPVSALDVSVQAQVLDLLIEIRKETGVSYLFITHDLAVVRQVADRVYVMHRGEIVEQGATIELLQHPRDTYTQALLAAVPGQWDRETGTALVARDS